MVRNVAYIYRYGNYNLEVQKAKREQSALNIWSNSKNNGNVDRIHISDTAQSFSKQSIEALIDKNANTTAQELSFYLSNYNNMDAILYAINFEKNVSCGYNLNFKEYPVDSSGYINASVDEELTSKEIIYPKRENG